MSGPRRRLLLLLMSASANLFLLPGAGQAAYTADVQQVRVGKAKVAYYERGSGPALLMLIGTGSTMSEWDPALLGLLARHWRLIIVDYPGVGLSSGSVAPTFSATADQISRFLAKSGHPRVSVLGWSMGGFIAQRMAAQHRHRVSRLILAGTNPGSPHAALGPPWVQNIDSDPGDDLAALKVLYPRTRTGQREGRFFLRRLIRGSQSGLIPDDFVVPVRSRRRQVASEDGWLRWRGNWRQLRSLAMPVLVTAGKRDQVTPPINAVRINRQIGRTSRLRLYPGAHAFLFQKRKAFAADLLRWRR